MLAYDFDSVADPDPGSWILDPGLGAFWPLDAGSGIRNRFFPDPGSQDHIFKSFLTIFLVKSSIFLWILAQILWNLWLHKKVWQLIFFHLSLLLLFLDPGSGMGKNQDPGSGINIPDPQHWTLTTRNVPQCLFNSLKIYKLKNRGIFSILFAKYGIPSTWNKTTVKVRNFLLYYLPSVSINKN